MKNETENENGKKENNNNKRLLLYYYNFIIMILQKEANILFLQIYISKKNKMLVFISLTWT